MQLLMCWFLERIVRACGEDGKATVQQGRSEMSALVPSISSIRLSAPLAAPGDEPSVHAGETMEYGASPADPFHRNLEYPDIFAASLAKQRGEALATNIVQKRQLHDLLDR